MTKAQALIEAKTYIGKQFTITIDRPIGTFHPKHPTIQYPINYGFIATLMGGDEEEQDVYVIDSTAPQEREDVTIIAVVHRRDDVETKWVGVIDPTKQYSKHELFNAIHFQEQFYKIEIITRNDINSVLS